MAKIRPFRAYRPRKGMEAKIAALPYDVYNREEAAAAVKKNPDSFLAIDRPETGLSPETDMYAPKVYERAGKLLKERIAEGSFIQEEKPCFYLYEQVFRGRSQTGVAACASIDDYRENVIKKHENTRADKELDRIRHVDACNMQTGPIFLACRENKDLRRIMEESKQESPLYDFVSEDQIAHRVWVVSEKEKIDRLTQCFAQMNALYIADGHHRCASAVKVGEMRRAAHPDYTGEEEFNFFLSVIFPEEELQILDYNRVVKDLNGYTETEFLEKLSEQGFVIEKKGKNPFRPEKKGSFGMFLGEEWYSLTAKEAVRSCNAVDGLDVSLLQRQILAPVLGITDPKTDKRIDFVGGIRGAEELERRVRTDMKAAFLLFPTSMTELFQVADAGLLMPPKSTWFEPKLRSGLFLHDLETK